MVCLVFSLVPSETGAGKDTTYTVLKSHQLDRGDGTRRMRYDIEVPEDTNDEEVRSVLNRAVNELATKREIDALVVRLYLKGTGSQHYAMATWAPNGDWGKAGREKPKSSFATNIEINSESRSTKASGKQGLSIEKKQQIYRDLYRSQDRTLQMAKQKYPNDAMKKWDYAKELDKKYEKEICKKYGITENEKASLMEEGIMKNWPH